jgi:hypothetical protein
MKSKNTCVVKTALIESTTVLDQDTTRHSEHLSLIKVVFFSYSYHLFIYLFIYLFVCLFVYLFVYFLLCIELCTPHVCR